jgi:hypothetical protein
LRSRPLAGAAAEIYFSILQRKALTPRHFASLAEIDQRIMSFQRDWQQHAT